MSVFAYSLEESLRIANGVLDKALSEKKSIPADVVKNCKGVAIIDSSQTAIIVSSTLGEGVVLKHNDDGSWSPPSALRFGGFGAGFNFGIGDKQILLFPMSDSGLRVLSGEASFKLGSELGVAVGKMRHEYEAGVNVGRGVDITYSYVFSNGAFVELGLDGTAMHAPNDVNEKFYGKKVKPTDILFTPGAVTVPKGRGYETLCSKLDQLSEA